MNPDQLKEALNDIISILAALQKVLPTKIDADLIAWLQTVQNDEWMLELLVNVLKRK